MADGPKPPHNPRDRFFRNAMEHSAVARDFMCYYLPNELSEALDLDSLKLEHDSYLNPALQEAVSDLVFSCQLAGEPAYLALLVEHQSRPDPNMPVRMGHYLFSLLTKQLKQQTDGHRALLAPVYALVFYHGSQSPYPYSLNLVDCFRDPLGIMSRWFNEPLPLVDVQQLSDEALKQQQWVGIVARALKHIRSADISPYLLEWLADCEGLDDHSQQWLDFIRSLLHYALRTGNVADIDDLIEETHNLPKPIGETFMTIAEQLEARGKAEGLKTTALNLLKEGAEPLFVAKVTGLPLEHVEQLQTQVNKK